MLEISATFCNVINCPFCNEGCMQEGAQGMFLNRLDVFYNFVFDPLLLSCSLQTLQSKMQHHVIFAGFPSSDFFYLGASFSRTLSPI